MSVNFEYKMVNCIETDKMARYEPSHLDLHYLQYIYIYIHVLFYRTKRVKIILKQLLSIHCSIPYNMHNGCLGFVYSRFQIFFYLVT